jgi:DNA-binding NtrC family response regulator
MESRSITSPLPSGRNVLVVEDEVRLRTMLSQALKQMGFQATLAPSAEAATRALSQASYDILILDLNLPGMGGMEFLDSLRRQHRDLQVIILTGFGDLDAAKKAIHLDVAGFLTKPCALGELEVALDRAQKRRRGQIVGQAPLASAMEFEPAPPANPIATNPLKDSANPQDTGPVSLEDLEEQHILSTLRKNGGNRAATANELGISLRKLYYRLGEYQRKGLIPASEEH